MNAQFLLRRRFPQTVILTASIICTCLSGGVFANSISVHSKAAGKFGAYRTVPDQDSLDLVEAYVFTTPGSVTITVSGQIDLHPSYAPAKGVGPEGVPLELVDRNGSFTPLEESTVDVKGADALPRAMKNNGAVFGAFVPKSMVDVPGFQSINEDFTSYGISSDKLFLVGTRFEFTAEEPGTLYLGVNDARPSNNAGSFTVTITAK